MARKAGLRLIGNLRFCRLHIGALADWKSAILQVGNLRYECRPTASLTCSLEALKIFNVHGPSRSGWAEESGAVGPIEFCVANAANKLKKVEMLMIFKA
jgi:hypothetical protein